MGKSELKISQCMIVKNEEDNIVRALSWGKDIVWEQIVVDTGSTDRTVEIAQSMGAKIFHFDWIDDFAAAKNYAISKASGDWIAFLDADEYMTEEWTQKLPGLLVELDKGCCHAVRSPWVCINENGDVTLTARHCRFFRNMPGLFYRGAIHESLTLNGIIISGVYLKDMEGKFPVLHTGYIPRDEQKKNRKERNVRILKKELDKNPGSCGLMGYLGDACAGDDIKEAEQWYRSAIEHMPEKLQRGDERSVMTFVQLLQCLIHQDVGEQQILEFYETAVQRIPWAYDMDYMLGKYYLSKNNLESAIHHLERGIWVAEEYGDTAYGVFMIRDMNKVWEWLARCHYNTGNSEKAIQYCTILLKLDNRQFDMLLMLLVLLSGEKMEQVLRFLENFYDIHSPADRIFLLRAAIRLRSGSLLQVIKAECTEDELAYLNQIM